MTQKSYKILITNVYSWLNKWDATIVLAMIENLQKNIKIEKIGISTVDTGDFWKYGETYTYYESLQNYVIKWQNKYLDTISALFFCIRFFVWGYILKYTHLDIARVCFSQKISNKLKSYDQYDVIVACWWGYTGTRWYLSIINKFLFSLDYFGAYFYWKPIFLYSQSFWPFRTSLHGKILGFLVKRTQVLMCREKISSEIVKNLGIMNSIETGDIAFSLWASKSSWSLRSREVLTIGMTMRKWFRDPLRQEQFEQEIANFITLLRRESQDFRILLLPQVIYAAWKDNDLECYAALWERVDFGNNVQVLNNDMTPYELRDIIASCDYFVWTRMHSNILALASWIRTIAIAYEHKTTGIMKDLWLGAYTCLIEDVTGQKIFDTFLKLKSDKSYLQILEKNLAAYKKRAEYAGQYIAEHLEG